MMKINTGVEDNDICHLEDVLDVTNRYLHFYLRVN